MKLGDVVLTLGSSSSSSSSTSTASAFTGITAINLTCDVDLDYIYDVIKTSDGNYLAACAVGYSYNCLIKYNQERIIWAKAYRIKNEGPYAEGGFVSEIDGYYYAAYKYWTDTETYSSSILYKIDSNGNEVWHKSSYSCWADDFPRGVVESVDDSTSIIWYFSYYDGGGDFSGGYTPVIYKLDKTTGETIWVKGVDNKGYGVYTQMIHTQDNNYLLANSRYDYYTMDYLYNADVHYHIVLFKIDNNGNKIWVKKYYRKNIYVLDVLTGIKLTADGGFIILVDSNSRPIPYHYADTWTYASYVLKTDSSGVPQWCTKILETGAQGNYFDDVPCKIHVLADGYVFVTYDQNTDNINLIKLSLTGSYVWGKTILSDALPSHAEGLWSPSVEITDTGFLIYGLMSAPLNQLGIMTIETDFDGNIDGCPYIMDGIANTIQEGYITEIVSETSYNITIEDATYMWAFSQPTTSTDFDIEHHKICPQESDYNCSEYFNGVNGSSPSEDILTLEYGVEGALTIQNDSLSYTPLTNPSPSWEAIRYNTKYQFNASSSFDYFISFNLFNLNGGMGGLELYASPQFYVQVLWGGYGSDGPIDYEATGYDDWQYYVTTDTVGKLRIRRNYYGVIVAYVWNSTLYRWEWNGNTNGLLLGTEIEPMTPGFRIFTYDQSTIRIPDFVVIDGCSSTTIV